MSAGKLRLFSGTHKGRVWNRIRRAPIYQWPRSERGGAFVASGAAKNILPPGDKQCSVSMKQAHRKSGRTCRNANIFLFVSINTSFQTDCCFSNLPCIRHEDSVQDLMNWQLRVLLDISTRDLRTCKRLSTFPLSWKSIQGLKDGSRTICRAIWCACKQKLAHTHTQIWSGKIEKKTSMLSYELRAIT